MYIVWGSGAMLINRGHYHVYRSVPPKISDLYFGTTQMISDQVSVYKLCTLCIHVFYLSTTTPPL